MGNKTIRQSVTFKASPHDVYETIMDSKKHAKFTGSIVKMSRMYVVSESGPKCNERFKGHCPAP